MSIARWSVSISLADLTTLIEPMAATGSMMRPHVAAVALAARTASDDQVGNEAVHALVGAERVVHRVGLGEELGQLLVQLLDGEGVVSSERLLCAVHADALSDPYLVLGIERVDEEDIRFIGAGAQDGHGVRLVEAGEVPEGRVLAELILDVVVASGEMPGGEDDGPAVERLGEARPPRRKVGLGEW